MGEHLTLKEAQFKVDEWIKTIGVKYFSELTNLGILIEEVGELARIMVREYGDQSFKESDKNISKPDELADILWVLICLANQMNIDLESALIKSIEKKTSRDGLRHKENPKLK
jgi:NTP pyrophosphatase (non-canonical NTP hydrolase)